MRPQQKIGMGFIFPLMSIALAHTVVNCINQNKKNAKVEVVDRAKTDNAIKSQSDSLTAEFRATQNVK